MLRLTLNLGDIKLADQTRQTAGSYIYFPDCEVKIIFAKILLSAPVSLNIILSVSCEAGVSWNASSPLFSLLLPLLCYPELLLRNLSVVCCGGTEVLVMAEVGAEKITASHWSLANKWSPHWPIKSASKHRH